MFAMLRPAVLAMLRSAVLAMLRPAVLATNIGCGWGMLCLLC